MTKQTAGSYQSYSFSRLVLVSKNLYLNTFPGIADAVGPGTALGELLFYETYNAEGHGSKALGSDKPMMEFHHL